MYAFQNLSRHGISPRGLPNEALLLKLDSGEWKSIEEMIDGYETLATSGRELFASDVQLTNPAASDGAIITSNWYKQRTITVKYRLRAKNDREFRDKFTRLNEILGRDYHTVMFNDDPNYYFRVMLSAADTPESGTNDVQSQFTLTCPDPFKHAVRSHVYKGDSQITITEQAGEPSLPEYILFTPASDCSNIVIQSANNKLGQHVICLEGAFKAGEGIKIIPLSRDNSNLYVYNIHSKENIADTMTFDSDIENFYLWEGSIVSASPQGTLEICYRKKAL